MQPHVLDAAWRGVLTALLLAACATDLRARRIPNTIVLAVFGAALVRAILVSVGALPIAGLAATPAGSVPSAILRAVLGALCGLALWLPLYAVRAFGAGDVKLFAAAAAWIGPAAVPSATLYAALAGGVLGLAWFGARRFTQLAPTLMPRALYTVLYATQRTIGGTSRVPYGIAIAAGVLGVVWSAP